MFTIDISKDIINVDLFIQSISSLIKLKLSDKASKAIQSVSQPIIEETQQEDQIYSDIEPIRNRISSILKTFGTSIIEIAISQSLFIDEQGFISQKDFISLLKSIPLKWTMLQKNTLYEQFIDANNKVKLTTFINMIELDPPAINEIRIMDLILSKLFTALLTSDMNIISLFHYIDQTKSNIITQEQILSTLSKDLSFLSPFEVIILLDNVLVGKSHHIQEFIKLFQEHLQQTSFNPLNILYPNSLALINYHNQSGTLFQCLEEFENSKSPQATLQYLYNLFHKLTVPISKPQLLSLVYNFLFQTTQVNYYFTEKFHLINHFEFFGFLQQQLSQPQIKTANNLFKEIKEKLDQATITIFELFAISDIFQDQQISFQELLYGLSQINCIYENSQQKMLYSQFHVNKNSKVGFKEFFMRFVQAGQINIITNESPLLEKFLTSIKKIGDDMNSIFNRFDKNNDGIITFNEFKNACFQFNLGLQLEEIETVYFLIIKKKYSKKDAPLNEKFIQIQVGINYKDFASLGEKHYHLIHRSYQRIHKFNWSNLLNNYFHRKKLAICEHISLEQLKDILQECKIPFDEINAIIQTFDKQMISQTDIQLQVQEYSNPYHMKNAIEQNKIQNLTQQILNAIKGQDLLNLMIEYKQGIEEMTFGDFYGFIQYLEIQTDKESIELLYNSIDLEKKGQLKIGDFNLFLRRQALVVNVNVSQRKSEIHLMIQQAIKQKPNWWQQLKLSQQITGEIIQKTLEIILSEKDVEILLKGIKLQGDFIMYCLNEKLFIPNPSDGTFAAKIFVGTCLELFLSVTQRLNIPIVSAIQYFSTTHVTHKEFIMMMLSINYDFLSLRINYKHIAQFFSTEFTTLEFAMLFQKEKLTASQEALPVLLSLYQIALKYSLNKHQLFSVLNINGSGWINREELLEVVHQLDPSISLENTRAMIRAVDREGLGNVSVASIVSNIYQASGLHLSSMNNFLVNTLITKILQSLVNDHPEDFDHQFKQLKNQLILKEQLGEGTDGLVQKITITSQEFFNIIQNVNFREEEKVQLQKAFLISNEQLDLEQILEVLEHLKQDFQLNLQLSNVKQKQSQLEQEQEPLEKSVVLKDLIQESNQSQNQQMSTQNNVVLLQTSILEHICAVLNQNQISLWQAMFDYDKQNAGYITVQQFQHVLRNIGINIPQLDYLSTLIKVIDRKSQGEIIHFTEILERMKQFGYEIITPEPDGISKVSLPNLLILELCSLEHMKAILYQNNENETLTAQEFYELVTQQGQIHPFSDSQMQRLANLFSHKGSIQFTAIKNTVERVQEILIKHGQDLLRRERSDENQISKDKLQNVLIRFNGFQLLDQLIRQIRELFFKNLEGLKNQKDLGLRSFCMQLAIDVSRQKLQKINKFLENDIQLLQASVYQNLSGYFAQKYILPHLQSVTNERTKISQLQMTMSSMFIMAIPESQFLPTSQAQIDDNPSMYMLKGKIAATNQQVKVQIYSIQMLATVCYDGVLVRQHLMEEMRLHQLMQKEFPLFPLLGVIEKRESMGTKLALVLDNKETQGYRCLSDVIKDMGGLIKIPSLVFSGQLVYLVKLYMQQILEFQCEIQNHGYSHPLLRCETIYVNEQNGKILIENLNGIQQVNHLGKYAAGINIELIIENGLKLKVTDLSIAPEYHYSKIQELSNQVDSWVFGVILFELLFGSKPQILQNMQIINNQLIISSVQSQTQTPEVVNIVNIIEPSDYQSGDLLQKEIFENMFYQLSDIVDLQVQTRNYIILQEVNAIYQMKCQLEKKSLGSFIQTLFSSENISFDDTLITQISQFVDLMCLCLQFQPFARPTLASIKKSGLFQLNTTDYANAISIARPIVTYLNPRLIYHSQVYLPARHLARLCILEKGDFLNSKQEIIQIVKAFQHCLAQSLITNDPTNNSAQKLDMISFLFHSKILDILVFIVLHFQHRSYILYDQLARSSQNTLDQITKDIHTVVYGFTNIFIDLQTHLSSFNNPASQHVEAILTSLVKFILGEPYCLVSDLLLNPKKENGFFINNEPDETDQAWENSNQDSKMSLWTPLVYKTAAPVYKDMISESGVGTGSMVAVRQFIQQCTEKEISPFDQNKFSIGNLSQKKDYNTIPRTSEYYNEVITISDAQLQISHYLKGNQGLSKSSLKIALNYLISLAKSNKLPKLQILIDSMVLNMLGSLLSDHDLIIRNMVVQLYVSISFAFTMTYQADSIQHISSSSSLISLYQQNNAIELLRNLSIITHVLNHSKSKLSNQRFLSIQPQNQRKTESQKIQILQFELAQQIFSVPSVYQSLYSALTDKGDSLQNKQEIFSLAKNLLQWKNVEKYGLNGACQQFLAELFRPLTSQIEKKPNPLQPYTLDLYNNIATSALPCTLQLLHHNHNVKILLKSHHLAVPPVSSPNYFMTILENAHQEWKNIKQSYLYEIRQQISQKLARKRKEEGSFQFFQNLKQTLKQIEAFILNSDKNELLDGKHWFLQVFIKLQKEMTEDLLTFGQLHQESKLILLSLSEFIANITNITPLLIFDLENHQNSFDLIKWMLQHINLIYEYHIEWDRINEEKKKREDEFIKQRKADREAEEKFAKEMNLSWLQLKKQEAQNQPTTLSIIAENKSLMIQTGQLERQKQVSFVSNSSQSKQNKKSTIKKPKSTIQVSEVKEGVSQITELFSTPIELRPYSSNNLIGVALNFLKCLIVILNSNIQKYLEILEHLNTGHWFVDLAFKMWIIFVRVISEQMEESLIIKNQIDESMLRISFFESLTKCSNQAIKQQVIDGGFIKGIFEHLLSNYRCFELQKILKTHSYIPFIHWMPYRHEALSYLTSILWERQNSMNMYNEMMIELHARSILSEESSYLNTTVDQKSKIHNNTIMFSRIYLLCLLLSTQDSSLLFLMVMKFIQQFSKKQLKVNQKLMQLFQSNEDFRSLFSGIYQYLISEELNLT